MSNRTRLRWLAPVAALTLAMSAPVAFSAVANADPSLPDKTAEQLLTDLASATPVAFSGEVEQTADLGLPDLSALSDLAGSMGGGAHSSAAPFDPLTLATGTNTWRVWADGNEAFKAALMVEGGEYSLTTNGTDVWFWDSAAGEALHGTAPDHAEPAAPAMTPAQLAQEVLAAIEPTTEVTTAGTRIVAGRPAYELVLTPNDDATRVGEVRLAIDAETSMPLALEVSSDTGVSAIDVAFTSVTFATPAASIFEFEPPAGATVGELPEIGSPDAGQPDTTTGGPEPVIVGEGWSTVLVLPAGAFEMGASGTEAMPMDPGSMPGLGGELPEGSAEELGTALDSVIAQLPTVSGDWGSGKLFAGTLFSAVIADDGRIAIGAVNPEALYAALAS